MFKCLLSSALVFGAVALAPPVNAQNVPTCMARQELVKNLENRYQETLAGGGLQNSNRLLEIWTSESTGSFTVLLTRPNGQSCIVASGQNWHSSIVLTTDDVAG